MRFKRFWPYRGILFSRRFLAALWQSRKNIIAVTRGQQPIHGPFMAELDVTYRCNYCCQMCQRWQDSRSDELTLTEYQTLSETLNEMGVYLVSIAGGEPLLREDIFL